MSNHSEKEIVQMLVAAAIARANGSTVIEFCDEKGIKTEDFYAWENRFGEINLRHIITIRSLRPLWIRELWEEYREVLRNFIGETLLAAIVILTLVGFDYVMDHVGFSATKRKIFDILHLVFSIGVLSIFASSSVIKLLGVALRGIQRAWRKKSDS